jgi:hypothetical protein
MIPFFASLSMFGVLARGSPYAPIAQFKSSAIINKTLSFFDVRRDLEPIVRRDIVIKKNNLNKFIRAL